MVNFEILTNTKIIDFYHSINEYYNYMSTFIIQIMEYYITLRDLNTGRKACASALIDNVVVSFFTFRSLMHPYVLN